MTTVAEFLRGKMRNMATWLKESGLETTLPEFQDVHIVALAQALHDKYTAAIDARDFAPLLGDKENVPLEVLKVIEHVRVRDELQDKFWRYLKLFSETVSVHE